jgi:L1 cell adhesion molecule like protein
LFLSRTAEDEAAAARIASKNALESYVYNLRNSLHDGKVADKLGPGDKSTLESAVNETINWLDAAQEGSKEEYDEKQKELEAIANPIMQKLYAAGGAPGASADGPNVEEVD